MKMTAASLAVTASLLFAAPASAVTLAQLNGLSDEHKDHVYSTIANAVIENSFDDPNVVDCARELFFTSYRGLDSSEGVLRFIAVMGNLENEEGGWDTRVQDLVFSLIRDKCVEGDQAEAPAAPAPSPAG
jgi:hypothetical protein